MRQDYINKFQDDITKHISKCLFDKTLAPYLFKKGEKVTGAGAINCKMHQL